MIAKLIIGNLKGFTGQRVLDLAPLTLLYGENSAGKSTILQALRLLREINNDSAPQGVRSIPFRDLVTNGNTDLLLSLGYEYAFEPNVSDMWNLHWLSEIDWDKAAQQPRLNAIQVFQVLSSDLPVFCFACEGTKLVNDSFLPYGIGLDGLCNNLDGHLGALCNGVERVIEARVLQNFLEAHAEEAGELHKAISAVVNRSCSKDTQGPYASTLLSEQDHELSKIIDVGIVDSVCKEKERHSAAVLAAGFAAHDAEMEKHRSNARSILAKWREHAPEWIAVCPRSWGEFRKSDDYQREAQALRATVFSDILNLCDDPKSVDLTETLIHCELTSPPTQDLQIREGLLHHLRDAISDPRIVIDPVRSKNGCPVSVRLERRTECFAELWKAFDATIEKTKSEWADLYNIAMHGLKSIKHVPPLREPPQRIYAREGCDGSAAYALARSNALVDAVNIWLERLGVDYVVGIHDLAPGSGYFQVLLSDRRRPEVPAVNYADTGFGVSQLLPILVAGLTGREQTILVEQPELHIHPRLQAELGSFFAECIKERGHQFIVETHSEHIMLRVQTLLRQKQLTARDVGVRYVCRTECGSSVQNLRVDDDGDFLDPWPGGFFPERYNEVLHS